MSADKPRSRLRGCGRLLLFGGAAIALATGIYTLATRPPAPETVSLQPQAMKPVGKVSERFLSYNVEMVEVTGGRFWRPYSDGKRSGDDRYEYRPPIDLEDARLRKLAAALGPAYMRVSGTWANATYFDSDGKTQGNPPDGFDTVLTGEQWRKAIEFAKAVDAQIVSSFATSPGVRDAAGQWQPLQAEKFLAFTEENGAKIAAAEYANEPETVELTQAPEGYTPADYRRDYGRFYEWMRQASPSTLILAPGVAELGEPTQTMRIWLSGMEVFDRKDLIAKGQHRPDGFSFHYYGGGSQRCGDIPLIDYGEADVRNPGWLSLIDRPIAITSALRDQVAPKAPLWLTETGETACGGNPWAATFADVFRFTDQMARSARQGVTVYMHNTLAASDYALLDEDTHLPRPNYWAAWLWKNLMGASVLDAGGGTTGLNVYAHCLRGRPGGVAILAINLDGESSRSLALPAGGKIFELREGAKPKEVLLNGRRLALTEENTLPELRGRPIAGTRVDIAPASVNFLTFDRAGNPACS